MLFSKPARVKDVSVTVSLTNKSEKSTNSDTCSINELVWICECQQTVIVPGRLIDSSVGFSSTGDRGGREVRNPEADTPTP